MKIGIIVYSKTGHTLSVAVKLKENLSAAGHVATLEKLDAAGKAGNTVLKTIPSVDAFDAIVFGSPVWGGSMPPPMRMYLDQITSLKGKKAACIATHFFFWALGGNQVVLAMKKICESKGAIVCGLGSISWTGFSRRQKISSLVESLSKLF